MDCVALSLPYTRQDVACNICGYFHVVSNMFPEIERCSRVECSIPVPRKYTILPEVSSLHIFMRAWPTYHVIICIVKMAPASTADSS